MTPGSVAPRTVHSVRPFSQLQPDQPVEMYFSLTTFQYGPMQHPAVQPISFLMLSTLSSDSPGSLSLSLSQNHQALSSDSPGSLSLAKVTYSQLKTTTLPYTATATKPHAAQLSTRIFTFTTLVWNPIAYIYKNFSSNTVHRHLNLVEPCNICPGCAHAFHRLASVVQLLCF